MKKLEMYVYGILQEFQAVIHGKEDNSFKDDELLGNYNRKMMDAIQCYLKETKQ